MIRNVFLVILCFCTFVLAQGADYEQDVFLSVKIDPVDMFDEWKARDNLLHALKEGDVAKADAALEFLSQAKVPESAIDSLELLQVNLILERYDLAVPQFANMLMKAGKRVRYSFADDGLKSYLKKETRFAAHYNDRPGDRDHRQRVEKAEFYLKSAMQANIKQEYKDLAQILIETQPFWEIYDKDYFTYSWDHSLKGYGISKDVDLANVIKVRASSYRYYRGVDVDTTKIERALEKMNEFCEKYPDSEYFSWIKKNVKDFDEYLKGYKKFRNYHEEKLYTGGLGFEVFGDALNWTFMFGVPIQYSRYIITPYYYRNKDLRGGFVSMGYDAYENKRFKFQPYFSLGTSIGPGVQADYRFWLESAPDSKFHIASYLSLKLRYMLGYTFDYRNDSRKDWVLYNFIFVGLGFHFW